MQSQSTRKDDAHRYFEEGAAFAQIVRARPEPAARHDVIVIGAGQAGLAVGYHLRERGLHFVVLDGAERIGDSWRKRWDSLRLFSPARFDGLPGMPFPADPDYFPTKDEMGDYLESYAERFELDVRTRMRVTRLSRRDGRYVVECGDETLEADQVVIAMADYQKRRVPDFARELRDDVVQLHSSEYKSPSQLREGPVLIVGAGNSGAEIGVELVKKRRVVMSGRDVGNVPFRIAGFLGRLFLLRLVFRFLFARVLSIRTPIGRKARPKILSQGGPLIRTRSRDLAAAGIERVPRVRGVRDGLPELEDGRVLDVANVVWCTGYHPGFTWIDLPIHGDRGRPRHEGGVVPDQPGLYFVGLHFLYSLASGMIHGVGRDAERIVKRIAEERAGAG